VGAKRPLAQKQIWAVRFSLDRERRIRDRALFDLAVDGIASRLLPGQDQDFRCGRRTGDQDTRDRSSANDGATGAV